MYSKVLVLAIISALLISLITPQATVIVNGYDNYYSKVSKINRTYYDQNIIVMPGDTHKVPTGAMELQYFISRNYTETTSPVDDTEFTFETLWAYSIANVNDKVDFYYVNPYDPTYDPQDIFVKGYRLTVRNTYYTWGREYIQEVSFNSIYAYDEDIGSQQANDDITSTIMNVLSTAWDFIIVIIEHYLEIPIPLPNPWQVLKSSINSNSNALNIPYQVDFNHDQVSDPNSQYAFYLQPKTDNQHLRRNFGLRESVRVEYAFDQDTPESLCIVFLWGFQPDLAIGNYYNTIYDIPQSPEPILFAEVDHEVFYLPPTGGSGPSPI